jgi:hypothetical protein
LPGKSKKFEKFYEKAWDPEKFKAGACCERDNIFEDNSKLKVTVSSLISQENSLI